MYVHPTAIVDEGAEVGEGTSIWHFVHVSEGARIGEGCSLGQNCFVGRNVRVGDGVRVQNNVSIYEGVEIESDAFLGPSCVFTNVTNPRSFVSRKHEYKSTKVGRGASIGANAVIVCGHDLGEYSFVGAGAVVTRDVPPYALVVGNPARRIGWMSRAGVRLPEGSDVCCPETGERYRIEGERCVPIDGDRAVGDRAVGDRVAGDRVVGDRAAGDRAVGDRAEGPVALLDLEAQNGPLRPAIEAAVASVVRKNQFIMGPEVAAFEAEVARAIGVEHAIGVSSGTDALLVALMALDVGPGDEVITTPFSFFATAGVIHRVGAKPVFVDIDPVTFNLDPAQVAPKLNERTRALLPVHLFGQPCDMEALKAAAPGVPIIEDAAQAIGATTEHGPIGGLGALGCFSFFPSKNLGAFGDGGLVTTNDAGLAEKVRRLRVHGSHPKYIHAMVGGNFRLDAIQAAVLRVKLPHLARWTEARRANAARYDSLLADITGVQTPERVEAGHVYNQYTIRAKDRDGLAEHLAAEKIGHAVYYPLALHQQECFAHLGHREGDLPVTEQACREVLSLPIYPEIGEARQRRVADAIAAFHR